MNPKESGGVNASNHKDATFHGGSPWAFSAANMAWNGRDVLDLSRWKDLLARNAWLIVLAIAASVGGMGYYVKSAPKIYASRAVIQVEQQQPKVLNKIENITEENPNSEDFLKTVAELLNSDSLMLQVAMVNNLDKDPGFAPRKRDGSPYLNSELAAMMKRKVRISQRRGSRLIDVEAEDRDPQRACMLANSIASEFMRQAFEHNTSTSKMANEFLYQQAAQLKRKLEASEQKLQQYKEEHQAVSLEEKQNITVEKLKDLNEKVTEANRTRLKLETDLRQVRAAGNNDISRLLRIESVAALPQVSEIQSQLVRARSDFAAITKRYLNGHPKYIAAVTQIHDLERSLREEINKSGDTLVQQYQAAKDMEEKMNGALKDQETKALELSKISIPYNVLSREAESDRILYDNIITRLKETGVAKGPEQVPYRIAENAMVPARAARPHRALLLLFALFGGGALGVGGAVAREVFHTTVRTVSEAERALHLQVLAAVPEKRRKGGEIEFVEHPTSAQADAIRSLRTSLSLPEKEGAHCAYVITSAEPVEGKSYVSVNLAAAFASQGLKTLVIDADLRRPQISDMLCGSESGEMPGLADYLRAAVPVDQIIYPFAGERLFMLPAGRAATAPGDLFAGAAFPELLQKLRQKFDRIILDTAPIAAVSDTLAFAAHADGVCLVVRAGKTPSGTIQTVKDQLANAGAEVRGIVLNRMAFRDVRNYDYRYERNRR